MELSLNRQLKTMVDGYLMKHPNMSLNGLAQKAGVGATTLRRIVHLTTKSEPAPHTVLNLVSTIHKEKCLPKLLAIEEGEVRRILVTSFSRYIYNNVEYTYSVDLNEILRDKINYFIYKLAANRSGTTIKQLEKLFGNSAISRIENLLELKVLYKDADDIIHAYQKNFTLDLATAKKHLPELVRFYRPENVADEKNIFYTMSESLNEEGIKLIRDIQRKAVKKVLEIIGDKKYDGKIPYFTLNLGERFDQGEEQ